MCWKVSMPQMPTVSTTARELVPQKDSPEPNSPLFGGDKNFSDIVKKRGISSLKINQTNSKDSTSPVDYNY